MNWFHKLLNPHCEHCLEERINPEVEYLKAELSRLQDKYDRLVERLVNPIPVKSETDTVSDNNLEPLRSGYKPWSQKRAELERATKLEDVNARDAALRRKNEQLEKDLNLVQHARDEQKAI